MKVYNALQLKNGAKAEGTQPHNIKSTSSIFT